jgi:hypothetical protein
MFAEIQFDNDWRHYVSGDQALVQVSTDSVNWITVWSRIGVSQRNSHELIDISNYVAESSFWVRFKSVQPTWDYWWVIDNVKIRVWDIVPVELTSFIGIVNENNVILNWSTATETNNRGFNIERKSGNDQFEEIGFAAGFGTSTEPHTYSFTDANLITGIYSYRLKQIDYDGSFEYSDVVDVELNLTPKEYTLDQNYPNPFNPSTTIKYSLPFKSNVKIMIYNMLGEKVNELINREEEAGYYEVNLNAGGLASGVYFYSMEAVGIDGTKFASVKKMLLMK